MTSGRAPPALVWYRPSIRRAAIRAVLVSMALTVSGSTILGALRVANVDFGSPWLAAYAVGITLVVAGPLRLWRRFLALMRIERVLTIHEDGVRWQVGDATPAFIAWDALEPLVIGPDGLVVAGGGLRWSVPLPLEGTPAEEVVALCRELRQKALLGLAVRPRARPRRDDDRV